MAPVFDNTYGNTATDVRGRIHVVSADGAVGMGVKVASKDYVRFYTNGAGTFVWRNPDTNAISTTMSVSPTGVVSWENNTSLVVPNRSSLPSASSTYRGVIVRVQGGEGVADALYWCRKKADDNYEWVQLDV